MVVETPSEPIDAFDSNDDFQNQVFDYERQVGASMQKYSDKLYGFDTIHLPSEMLQLGFKRS